MKMSSSEDESPAAGLRRGPWTVEEDLLLVNYIAAHGEGRWNALARSAGLKRTGKSCRLRWLNYLRPDLRRGNITAQEQLLILELHSRWGNRWSKIAQHLPGRTDNEIKNYWRTRVQKHARHLGCDVNSQQFKDLVRCLWMPRLLQQHFINEAEAEASSVSTDGTQQQPLVSPPAMLSASQCGGNDWSSWCSDNNNNDMPSMWLQPPDATTPQYLDVAADMSSSLLDFGETMWGADDLWYTQIMGLCRTGSRQSWEQINKILSPVQALL